MLRKQTEIQFSDYSDLYDRIVPADNDLRRIKELVDFSFVYEEVSDKYCPDNGRMSEDPVMLFKYLLLKCLADKSDRYIVEHSRYDMSYKYFLGLMPEDDVIERSTLAKFRRLRLQDPVLLDKLIDKTVEIAQAHGLLKSKSLIVDSTHTRSRFNQIPPLEVLRDRAKKLRNSIYDFDEGCIERLPAKNGDDDLGNEIDYCEKVVGIVRADKGLSVIPAVNECADYLEEAVDDIRDHAVTSADRDARRGHKTEDSEFFGYKTHIAMTGDRIITAATVTPGSEDDGTHLPDLLQKTLDRGVEVEDLVGDGAYSKKAIIKMTREEGINLVSRLNSLVLNAEEDSNLKNMVYNKDSGMMECKGGYQAYRKKSSARDAAETGYNYYFYVGKCARCKFMKECHPNGIRKKDHMVHLNKSHKNIKAKYPEQIAYQKTEEFREKYKERYKIEPKNSEMKNLHGYDRADSNGIGSMKLQGAVTIFTVNIKRILTLIRQNEGK